MLEKKVLVITENIEMDLLSSESRLLTSVQKTLHPVQERREHPPALDVAEAQSPVQPGHPAQLTTPEDPDPLECTEEIEIEMEVFPPLRISESELVEVQSEHSSIISVHAGGARRSEVLRLLGSSRTSRMSGTCGHMILLSHDWPQTDGLTPKCHRVHWRRRTPQTSRLAVKDVVCLPADYDMERLDRVQGRERALSAVALTARVTIDRTWSADQVESRLTAIFAGERPRNAPRRRLTFLQCVPGSRVLFVPQTPASGWTGDQVLRISAFSVLYVVCHYDGQQVTPPSC
ncbi:uncharacterized protein LOC128757918 isoform X1 [Synchiropus splendidus]|uniref:uncharacterized protein LOC128757918 isoform X1 n=1 Tax=Synchiropus splendidus TaxID=270530 RepID=UPI00237D9A34|nr:uncharacterized protein LOC128757918 isoform X1 [Synchiropus splendidus]